MPRVTLDKTDATDLATGSNTTIADGRYELPGDGWLTAVSLNALGSAVGGPVDATIDLVIGGTLIRLAGGQLRQLETPTQGGVAWHGRVPLGIGGGRPNHLRFYITNDTGSTFTWQGAWVVEHER